MTWTKEKPTKPGFYWLRESRYSHEHAESIVYLDTEWPPWEKRTKQPMVFDVAGVQRFLTQISGDSEWSGPIQPPKG